MTFSTDTQKQCVLESVQLHESWATREKIFACVKCARCGVLFTPPSLTRESLLPVSENLGKKLFVLSTPSILLMTTRWLKKTMQKRATIPNRFWGPLSMQQVSLIVGIVVLVCVELEVDLVTSFFSFRSNFTNSSYCFGIVWSWLHWSDWSLTI